MPVTIQLIGGMNIKRMKKLIVALLSSVAFAAFGGTVLAAVQYPTADSVWTYGGGQKYLGQLYAYANFYHGSKYHSSTVVSRYDANSHKGFAVAGRASYASIDTFWGEQVAFYYDY